jgi:hypothetical protein
LGNRNRQLSNSPKKTSWSSSHGVGTVCLGEGAWRFRVTCKLLTTLLFSTKHAMENSKNLPHLSSELLLFMHIHQIVDLNALLLLSEEELWTMKGISVHLLLEINVLKNSHLNLD